MGCFTMTECEDKRDACLTFFAAAFFFLVGCGQSDDAPPAPDVQPSESAATVDRLIAVPGLDSAVFTQSLTPILEKVEADQDPGWSSEVFSAEARAQLDILAAALEEHTTAGAMDIFGGAVAMNAVRPTEMQTVLEDGLVRIQRGESGRVENATPESVRKALEALIAPFSEAAETDVSFKLFRVRPGETKVGATVYYHASGDAAEGTTEQSATWECEFSRESPPRLLSVQVSGFEEVSPVARGGLRFVDATEAVLGENASYTGQLSVGIDHWRSRLQGDFGVDVNGLQGLAIGDANGDGRDDLYVCQQGGLPNRLYLRQEDGRLKDYSEASGTNWMELTRAALFVDLDNDGDQDLALAQGWYLMLMENDGKAKFSKRLERRAEGQLHSLAAADYDNDGNLDIFFCGRNPAREQSAAEGILGMPLPYHDANNGGPNVLLRHGGDWKFEDVTRAVGLEVNNRRYSYACSWEDYDNDGDQDLYVANDFGRNNLYRNDDGVFLDVAEQLGVEDLSAGMSVTWGDANRDGLMDVYVSNMFSSAGNRIAYQRQFRAGQTSGALPAFQRHARGNTLFLNRAGGGFEDVSVAAQVTMGRWAWGAKFADLNNDGWEDLYVGNGFITTEDTGDL